MQIYTNEFFSSNIVFILFFFISMIIVSYTDIKSYTIYDKHLIVFVFIAFILRNTIFVTPLHNYFIFSSIICFCFFLIIGIISNKPIGGDIKLAAYMGYILGIHIMLCVVILSVLFSFLFIILQKYTLKLNNKNIVMLSVLIPFLLSFKSDDKNTKEALVLKNKNYIPYAFCLFISFISYLSLYVLIK